ncbi:MAG: DUF3500 domain-containing protein [Pirellulaceae bacterium]
MLNETRYYCPECDEGFVLPPVRSRRGFLQTLGGAAALVAAGSGLSRVRAEDQPATTAKPAEGLIRELHATLTPEQKKELILPYDHGNEGGRPTRQRTFNSAVNDKRIADSYTKPQQELVGRIVRSILASDEALERISRKGTWDSSGSLEGCGAVLFGDPADEGKFAWVFSGHHLTLRCDGNSQPGAAFGGPVYYGHSEDGYSKDNVYRYQTQQVQAVYDALDEKQRTTAMAPKNPGDGLGGLKPQNPRHGIAYSELTAEQKQLVEKVMRTLLAPFRKEDVDEVMQIVKAGGGMEQINLAFYQDDAKDAKEPWHFWRLEGPGFVWNYRVLPHVHCFVNIASA